MKGITPIISIIVLLLITVSLAGAAYVFLGGYLSGLTSRAVTVTGACMGGDTAFLTITNMGSEEIDLTTACQGDANTFGAPAATCGDITIVRSDSDVNIVGGFDLAAIPAATASQVNAAHFRDTECGSGNICEYAVTRAGEFHPIEVSVRC